MTFPTEASAWVGNVTVGVTCFGGLMVTLNPKEQKWLRLVRAFCGWVVGSGLRGVGRSVAVFGIWDPDVLARARV